MCRERSLLAGNILKSLGKSQSSGTMFPLECILGASAPVPYLPRKRITADEFNT
jgi:hypothetical protein